MGFMDFVSNAGKQIAAAGRAEREQALKTHVTSLGLNIQNLDVKYAGDGEDAITISGTAATRADAEKAALMAGNVSGISRVDNQIQVTNDEGESQTYTVQSGDSLSKIAKQFYGDANKYNTIFEANRPMLKDADEIYPGQVLRIPQA